jgi:hypothetical protein
MAMATNYEAMAQLIRSFSGQENTIGVPRVYVRLMNSLEGGVFLSQLIFWSDKGGREDGWFYKTYQEWWDDINLSEYEVRKWAKVLVKQGVLETKVMRANGSPTVHYRLDMAKFSEWILKFLRNENEKSQEPKAKIQDSITEITTETTTELADPQTDKSNDDLSVEPPIEPQQATFLAFPAGYAVTKNGSQHGKKKRGKAPSPPNPNTQPIMDAYVAELGRKPANYAKESAFAKRLAEDGYAPEQVQIVYRRMKAEPFWASKFLSLSKVHEQIGEVFPPPSSTVTVNGSSGSKSSYHFLTDETMFL